MPSESEDEWRKGASPFMIMIDWLTFSAPLFHPDAITGGSVLCITPDGEQEWISHKAASMVGSYDSRIQVKSCRQTNNAEGFHRVLISGNPAKYFQGHNLFGTDDVHGLCLDLLESISSHLGLKVSDNDRTSWCKGDSIQLTRVDLTYSFDLPDRKSVRAFIQSAELTSHMRHRGRGVLKEGTLYFGKHSRRWALKMYCKGDEIEAAGHRLPQGLEATKLPTWADNKLRVELVLRSQELKQQHQNTAANWKKLEPHTIFAEKLAGLEMNTTLRIPEGKLQGLPAGAQMAYQLWRDGHDVRTLLPRNTFYRHRRALLAHGVDISTKGAAKAEVIPLPRFLDATPAQVPEWAQEQGYYYAAGGYQ